MPIDKQKVGLLVEGTSTWGGEDTSTRARTGRASSARPCLPWRLVHPRLMSTAMRALFFILAGTPIVFEDGAGKVQYHLFAEYMVNNCPLGNWANNSQVPEHKQRQLC